MKSIFAIIVFTVISATVALPQSTFQFLRLDVSPRAAAMGGSLTASDDDPDVLFYNPAGISRIKGTPVSFSFTKHLIDVKMAGLSATHNFEGIGNFGAGFKYINWGDFKGANEFGEFTQDFGAGEIVFNAGYSNFLGDDLSYGVGAEFIYSSIENYSSTGLGFNTGLNYSIPQERINIALSVMHMGTQLSTYAGVTENLPVDVRIGLSKRLQYLPLKFYIDFQRLNEDYNSFFSRFKHFTFGGEFQIGKSVKVRAGLDNQSRQDFKVANFAGLAGFSLGLGLNVSTYTFSYSLTSLGDVGTLQRVGVYTNFDM